jgi:hypothetical protein
VSLSYENGFINCDLVSTIDSKHYYLEMRPCACPAKRGELIDQAKRLYFAVEFGSTAKANTLKLMGRDDFQENPCYVVRIKGSKCKYSNLRIFRGEEPLSEVTCFVQVDEQTTYQVVLSSEGGAAGSCDNNSNESGSMVRF